MTALYGGLIPVCALTSALGLLAWRWPAPAAPRRLAAGAVVLAFVLTLGAWILRWIEAGHWPIFGTWESALSLALAVLAAAVATIVKTTAARTPLVGTFAGAVAAALLAHGRGFDATPYALTISERSWVVDVHAVCAWTAFGCLAANSGLALARIANRGGDAVERLLVTTLRLGFVLHSAMLATGSLYKFLLFGHAWSFDPIETLGLFAWLAYGTLLHLQLLAGWQGRRLAAWCLALFVVLFVSYRGIVTFPAWSTYHIFDIDLRLHR